MGNALCACAVVRPQARVLSALFWWRRGMSTKVPYLSRLGIYRISNEKQETLLKLMVLTTAAVLCKTMCGKLYLEQCTHDLWFIVILLIPAFSTRLFAVLRFESVIHEFDPYFNYRSTKYLTEEGFYRFHNWFDDRAWYPLGRIIGGTIYPGEGGEVSSETFCTHYVCTTKHVVVELV